MRVNPSLLVLLSTVAFAVCPLGFPPDQACSESNPFCALYVDVNGDLLCDNPEEAVEEEQPVEEEFTEAVTSTLPEDPPFEPDPVVAEEEEPFEDPVPVALVVENPVTSEPSADAEEISLPIEDSPETVADENVVVELVCCPLGYSPDEACPTEDPGCVLFRDPDENDFCDNPLFDLEESLIIDPDDSIADVSAIPCPLDLTSEDACLSDEPLCTLFSDENLDDQCDNPVDQAVAGTTSPLVRDPNGCPLYLAPEAACSLPLRLCPHWYGVTEGVTCSVPAGGNRRLLTVLIGLSVLLPVSTYLSRKLRGRRIGERLYRNTSHLVMRGISLMVLGFAVQGCFCPLGSFQYFFLKDGLLFLGWMGIAILLLPIVFSLLFGRIFCGWVCPMGALQTFLYRLHVPGRFAPKGKISDILGWLPYVILGGLIAILLLSGNDTTGPWPALFCRVDPFHTIFTLFVSGSLLTAGVFILLSIFIRRFFCRYLCFFGAFLAVCGRANLWSLILRKARKEETEEEELELELEAEIDRRK